MQVINMFKYAVVFLTFFLFASIHAQSPTFSKLIYEHDLMSEESNEFVEIIDKKGEFTKDGWRGTRGDSKMIIKFTDRLPQVGSVEFTMFGFVPTVHVYDDEHVLCMLTSSWDNPLPLDGEEAWLSIRTGKQYLYQNEALAFELDAAPAGHSTRQQSFTPHDKVWEKAHAYKFRFAFDHDYLVVYIDEEEYAQFQFDGQAQRFKYLFLAGDYLHTSIVGIRFSNFKVYTHEPVSDSYFVDKTYSKNVMGSGPGNGGQGVAIADVNSDGLDDIYVSNCMPDSCKSDILYIQQADSSFVDESQARGLMDECCSYGVVFFDADNDGDVDLFRANGGTSNQLYINNGAGYFANESTPRGISNSAGDTRGAVAFDVNNDGWLDLFAVNSSQVNEMYINDGTGHFTLETRGAEGQAENSQQISSHGVTVADIDDDRDFDIYISTKNSTNELYINDAGYFTQVAEERGVDVAGVSRGATFADFDNDGDMDLFVNNTEQNEESSFLIIFENDGNGYFSNRTADFNLYADGFTTQLMDIDNDSDLDIYRLNTNTAALLALNDGSGFFTDTDFDGSDIVGASARACAASDFDRDGDLDFYAINSDFENVYLENNLNNNNNFIKIDLVGPAGDAGGVGSKIDIYESGHINDPNYLIGHRQVTTAMGYLSNNGLEQHFGLARRFACDVRVTFVNGLSVEQTNVPANQQITITAPERYNILEYISGNDQSGIINTLLPQPFKVRIINQDGFPVSNEMVNFVVTYGDGSTDGSSGVRTDADGYASAYFRLGATAGQHVVEARVPGAQNSPIRFSATAQAAALIIEKVSGDNQTGPAGQPLPQQLVVQTRYDNGAIAQNVDVAFAVISGGGSIDGRPSVVAASDANGRAAVTWTLGVVSGQQMLQAAVSENSVNFYGTAVAGDPAILTEISGAGQTLTPGAPFSQPYVAQVTDSYGNPVPNYDVEFQVTSGGGTVNAAAQASFKSDLQGYVYASWTPGPFLGPTNTLQAFCSFQGKPLDGSPITWSYAGKEVSASHSTVTASSPVPANASSTSTIHITLRNSQNQSVGTGFTVDIRVTGSGNTLNVQNPVTDSNGQVVATLSSFIAEVKTITVIVKGLELELTQHPTVEFQSIDQKPDRIEIMSDQSQNVVVNQTSQPLIVRILDTQSLPIANYDVSFVLTSGEGAIDGQAEQNLKTGADGKASVHFHTGRSAGVVSTIEARAADVANSPVTFTLTSVADEPRGLAIISGNNQQGRPNTMLPQPLTVRVQDIYNNPVANVPVQFTVNMGDCNLDGVKQITVYSDDNGHASVTATTGERQGQCLIEAKTAFSSVVYTLMVIEALPDPDLSLSTLTATSPVLADGLSTSDVLVTIVDENSKPIQGIKIKLLAFGSGVKLMQPDSLTNSDGELAAQLSSTAAGEKFVLAAVLPKNQYLEQKATVVFEQGNPSVELVSGDEQTGVAGQKCPQPLVVRLLNGESPYVNQYVRFTVASGGGHFDGQDSVLVRTDAQGLASIDYVLGTRVEQNIIHAAAPIALEKRVTFRIAAKPGLPDKLVKRSGDEQAGRVDKPLDRALMVMVTDIYDNPTPNASVTFSAVDGGSIVAPQTVLTDSLGTAQATARCGESIGQYTFKAALENGAFVLFRATADKINSAPQVISYQPLEHDLTFRYNERMTFQIMQVFDPDGDPIYFDWRINDQPIGNQAKLLLFMSQSFGPNNTLQCTITDGQDSTSLIWSLKLDTSVELLSFCTMTEKRGRVINWTTAANSDHYSFRILRSKSRHSDFAPVTEAFMPWTSSGIYKFTDSETVPPGEYFYKLESRDAAGRITEHGPISITIQAPDKIALLQNYPNPFNPTTTFAFELPTTLHVRLVIYNQKGQLVRELLQRDMPAGFHSIVWDGRDASGRQVPTGIYLYRLNAGDFSEIKKLTLIK